MKEKIVQTAGREQLGEFAPSFAHLNDDVLFGEVWNEEAIDVKTKCIITVVSLMASGITDSSLSYHLQNAKGRNRRDYHPRDNVRWLAEGLGGVPPCKGGLERGSSCADRKGKICKFNFLPDRRAQSLRRIFRRSKLSCTGFNRASADLQRNL